MWKLKCWCKVCTAFRYRFGKIDISSMYCIKRAMCGGKLSTRMTETCMLGLCMVVRYEPSVYVHDPPSFFVKATESCDTEVTMFFGLLAMTSSMVT